MRLTTIALRRLAESRNRQPALGGTYGTYSTYSTYGTYGTYSSPLIMGNWTR